jgi:uncharacterized protein YkwD
MMPSFPAKPPSWIMLLPVALLLVAPTFGASPQASDELLTALQTSMRTGEDISPLIERLDDLPSSDLNRMSKDFSKAWPKQLEGYYEAFAASARAQHSGGARTDQQKKLRTLRNDFHKVRQMGEGPMKNLVKKTSWPAMQSLREILIPSAAGVLKNGPPALLEQRGQLLILAEFRNGLLEASVSVDPPLGLMEIAVAEQNFTDEYSGLDRDGLRIMQGNATLAAKEELPLPEVKGLRELNEMRLLVGLTALVIDPKLCLAGRGHSQDMAEHGFFSHTSPLAGKESPSKRAAKAGTTGGGENIYMGSTSPQAANRGWFFSPGHHKNMFNPGYRRVGLGNYGTHWTQMFGR